MGIQGVVSSPTTIARQVCESHVTYDVAIGEGSRDKHPKNHPHWTQFCGTGEIKYILPLNNNKLMLGERIIFLITYFYLPIKLFIAYRPLMILSF